MNWGLALVGLLRHIFQPKFKSRIRGLLSHIILEKLVFVRIFFKSQRRCLLEPKEWKLVAQLCRFSKSGGPIPQAERVGSFLALHGMNPEEKRRLHIGFSAGRFEFMARPYGIVPRDEVEEAAWPALRGQIFAEASEIFLRLLNGEVISSGNDSERPS